MKTIVWPYIELARHLIKIERKGFGNMFRHQLETFAILIEFGYDDPVLLKASLIHDLMEDGSQTGFTDFNHIIATDHDGQDVYDLVQEMTRRTNGNEEEQKAIFLERIMQNGTRHAKLLKLADRLSNVNSLFSTNNKEFIKRYCRETRDHIMPYAYKIDKRVACELEKSLNKLEGLSFSEDSDDRLTIL
jgi:(p)ppGpp synthase/HD superfamily hydrolase